MPQANGVFVRFMGSLQRECLDHILIHDDKHLRRVVTEYSTYFNQERCHQGIEQRIPNYGDTRLLTSQCSSIHGGFLALLLPLILATSQPASSQPYSLQSPICK